MNSSKSVYRCIGLLLSVHNYTTFLDEYFLLWQLEKMKNLSDAYCDVYGVVPENINTSPMEGIFSKTPHPSGNSN